MRGYDPHETLVAPARNSASPWRLALGVVVLVGVFFGLSTAWIAGLARLPNAPDLFDAMMSGQSPLGMALLLGGFAWLLAALAVAMRLVHGRRVRELLGPWPEAVRQALKVARAVALLFAVVYVIPSPEALTPERAMPLGRWLGLLPLSLGLLILQCGAEELVFRGYLQSQLAARFRSPVIWMGLPSLGFAALHYEPSLYGDVAVWVVVWTALFGLCAADLTARTGTLGPAIALHVVNNFVALSLVAINGHMDGLALYVTPFGPGDTEAMWQIIPFEGTALLCAWLAARIALRR